MPNVKAPTPNVYLIVFVLVCNFLIFAVLRYLLDHEDSNGQPLLMGRVRDLVSGFLGIFIMTFFFCCCCCFCCGKQIICINRLTQQQLEAVKGECDKKNSESVALKTPNRLEVIAAPKTSTSSLNFLKPAVKHTLSSSSPNLRSVSPATSPTSHSSKESLIAKLHQRLVVPGV
uniref:Uncharacterized protein n=1 Tax=Plectus sambesii TaxID=2011161 RepID=A0A914UY23_9BILA